MNNTGGDMRQREFHFVVALVFVYRLDSDAHCEYTSPWPRLNACMEGGLPSCHVPQSDKVAAVTFPVAAVYRRRLRTQGSHRLPAGTQTGCAAP